MNVVLQRWATAAIEHSEAWGMVWFGLVFWGSVMHALTMRLLPGADPWVLGWAAYATGLAVGALAKARGRWL